MEYFGKIAAVTIDDLTRSDDGEAVMTVPNYKQLVARRRINVLRPGKGLGCYALIEYSSLPERFRTRFEQKYGNPEAILNDDKMELTRNNAARQFFAGIEEGAYRLPNGERLPLNKQDEYTLNASVLDALQEQLNTQKMMRRALTNNTPVIWEAIITAAEQLRKEYGHTLPGNPARLKDKLKAYACEGFACLISRKFCNANTLKITEAAGRQIIALRRSRVPVYTTQQLFDKFNEIAEKKGWKPLRSLNSLTQYLERPGVKPRWYDAVYGELAARQLFARQHRTELPSVRDALWYGDGTKLNLYYRDRNKDGKTVLKTLQVYEVIDAFSEVLLGYCISETENYDAQYRAYRMAIERSGHKPYEIVHDNQGGHGKLDTAGFLQHICHTARPTAPYSGQSKTIESVFGRFQSQVLHRDWRFTGQNITAKKASSHVNREFIEANVDGLYTREELLAAYAEARETWNDMKHHSTGVARRAMYEASTNPEAPAVDRLDLIDMFWMTTEVPSAYTAAGIEIVVDKQKYAYEVLDPAGMPDMAFRDHNTCRMFYTMYDPLDMSMVQLCTKDKNGLRIIAPAYPYLTIHRAMQEQQPGERSFITEADTLNKRERVRRQIENKQLELEHGVAPEQHGLRSPRLKGISLKQTERIADQLLISVPTSEGEPVAVGEYTKTISNMERSDASSIFNRM